jgi:hypothetical protein
MVQGRGQAWFDDFALVEEQPAKPHEGSAESPPGKPSEVESSKQVDD